MADNDDPSPPKVDDTEDQSPPMAFWAVLISWLGMELLLALLGIWFFSGMSDRSAALGALVSFLVTGAAVAFVALIVLVVLARRPKGSA